MGMRRKMSTHRKRCRAYDQQARCWLQSNPLVKPEVAKVVKLVEEVKDFDIVSVGELARMIDFAQESGRGGRAGELVDSVIIVEEGAVERRLARSRGMVDVWAMGVITYFLLCGYTPFDRDTQQLEMEAIIAGDYKFEPGAFLSPLSFPLPRNVI